MESFGEKREKRREEKRVAVYITGSVRGCPSINRGATPVINRSDDRVCLVQDPVESSRRLRPPPVPLRGYLSGGTGPAITTTLEENGLELSHSSLSRVFRVVCVYVHDYPCHRGHRRATRCRVKKEGEEKERREGSFYHLVKGIIIDN